MTYHKIVNILKKNRRNIYFRYTLSFLCGLALSVLLNDIPFIANVTENIVMSWHLDKLLTFLTVGCLNVLSYPVETVNGQICVGTEKFYFAYGCLGIRHVALFAGFIFTYFGNIKHKLIYIAFGCVVLTAANIFRAVLIGIAIYYNPNWFDFVHYYGSMVILYSTIFVLWVIWSRKQTEK